MVMPDEELDHVTQAVGEVQLEAKEGVKEEVKAAEEVYFPPPPADWLVDLKPLIELDEPEAEQAPRGEEKGEEQTEVQTEQTQETAPIPESTVSQNI